MHVTRIIISVLLALLFLGTGLAKLTGAKVSRDDAERFGFPYPRFRLIGVAEVLGAVGLIVGLFVPWIAVVSGIGLVLLMIGGAATHLRAKDPVPKAVPAVVAGALSAVVVVLALP